MISTTSSISICLPMFFLLLAGCSTPGPVKNGPAESEESPFAFARKDDQIKVLVQGEPLTSFHFNTKWDKPFLYPIRSASGIVISRGYPIEPREGEEQDHAWHRGIWYGYGDINGEDFWRELGRDKTGRIVLRGEPKTETSGASGVLKTEMELITPKDQVLGTVREEFRFSGAGDLIIIDARIVVVADQGVPLTFGDTDDGGFGMRLSDHFRQDHGAALINSEGQRDTENIWGKKAKWVDYSARVDGKKIGVAMFDHPTNFRHPTTWHARGYSLCAANPFGLRSYTGQETVDGSYTIPEGESISLRYRVVIHEGETTPQEIEEWYADFASAE